MDQPTLTEFYTTKKRPIEGIHPAKRRKVIQTESVAITGGKTYQEDVKIAPQRTKTRTSSRSVQGTTRKTRRKTAAKNTQSSCLEVFLNTGMKGSSADSEKLGIEVTSVVDDHDSAAVASKDETSSTRRRKTGVKVQERSSAPVRPQDESCEVKQKNILKVRSTRQSHRATTLAKEAQASIDAKSKSNEEEMDKAESKSSLLVQAKSPVKNSASGLKINPWIADQANKVLLSRGQAALLLSQQKSASVTHSSKSRTQKPKEAAKNVLSKTKAQEGLEKARELIKKMRSLESDASRAKETSTTNKTERLHKLAKKQLSDATSVESTASSPKKAAAYERFHSLAQPSEATVTLRLPYKYKVLGEMFTSCDTILNLLGQRIETCTFDKLKASVQQMSRKLSQLASMLLKFIPLGNKILCSRKFEKKHLAQMMFVIPNSYDVQQVRSKSASYQLTIQFGPAKNSKDCRLMVSTTELLSRRKVFHDTLLTTTKEHHQAFLKNLEVPLSIDDDKIIRWHPQFKLDNVPDIEQLALPESPVTKTYTSAQDVLDMGLMTPKVEKALTNVAQKSKEKTKIDITYDSQPRGEDKLYQAKNKNIKINSALKGVSQDLLNKIRQKEAKKLEEKMMRDPVLDKKMIMQERLPELCRILKTYFTSEKKAAIPLEDATIKLSESYKSALSPGQVKEHLKLLSELAPEWFSMLLVRKCPYIKINKKADVNAIIKKVTQKEIK